MTEIFKDVKGYEGLYQVSNLGRVKSLPKRNSPHINILTQNLSAKKYMSVSLHKDKKGKQKLIHTLIAESFLNHKPNGHKLVVDHINNNPLDNRLENIQIITNRENSSKDKINRTGFTGVYYEAANKNYRSRIKIDGKLIHLGTFDCKHKANDAYQNKLKSL